MGLARADRDKPTISEAWIYPNEMATAGTHTGASRSTISMTPQLPRPRYSLLCDLHRPRIF
jgi:hypothetical protein